MYFKPITLAMLTAVGIFAANAPASASPFSFAAPIATAGGGGAVEIGGRHHRRHGRRHRHHGADFSLHFRNGVVRFGHSQGRRCKVSLVKVYDRYADAFYYERRRVCSRRF